MSSIELRKSHKVGFALQIVLSGILLKFSRASEVLLAVVGSCRFRDRSARSVVAVPKMACENFLGIQCSQQIKYCKLSRCKRVLWRYELSYGDLSRIIQRLYRRVQGIRENTEIVVWPMVRRERSSSGPSSWGCGTAS